MKLKAYTVTLNKHDEHDNHFIVQMLNFHY